MISRICSADCQADAEVSKLQVSRENLLQWNVVIILISRGCNLVHVLYRDVPLATPLVYSFQGRKDSSDDSHCGTRHESYDLNIASMLIALQLSLL